MDTLAELQDKAYPQSGRGLCILKPPSGTPDIQELDAISAEGLHEKVLLYIDINCVVN